MSKARGPGFYQPGKRPNTLLIRYHHPAFRFVGEKHQQRRRKYAITTRHFGLLVKNTNKGGEGGETPKF
jgi:hypothetical protein